jgi:putative flippase GtrA
MAINNFINIKEIISFAAVGTVGFVLDAAIVWALINYAAISPIPAKFMAFPCAVTVTWLLNRNSTFKANQQSNYLKEWLLYIQINSIGTFANNLSFIVLVSINTFLYENPIVTVAIGSIFGMLFNYFGSKYWVFNKKSDR